MNIGFVGLGVMGLPMAGHLVAAGHKVHLNRVRNASQHLVDEGGIPCASAAEVARNSEVVFLMVPDTSDVESVLFAEQGIASGLRPGTLVVDMSSISPLATRDFAERIEAIGGDYLDAPVSGGEIGAKNATLTIMVGGRETAFARALPLFEKMGKSITYVGGVGDGQIAKIANQIIVALTIEAVGEALLFASKAGADPTRVRDAICGGFAASRILDVHGPRMLAQQYEPGFRIRLHHKDLKLALESASQLGVALPSTALTQQLMTAAIAQGAGDLDHSALIETLAALSGK